MTSMAAMACLTQYNARMEGVTGASASGAGVSSNSNVSGGKRGWKGMIGRMVVVEGAVLTPITSRCGGNSPPTLLHRCDSIGKQFSPLEPCMV